MTACSPPTRRCGLYSRATWRCRQAADDNDPDRCRQYASGRSDIAGCARSRARHAGYGVKAADYDTVAGALLGTLEQALGSEFTLAVRDAWAAYYQTLAGEMKAAAPVRGRDS